MRASHRKLTRQNELLLALLALAAPALAHAGQCTAHSPPGRAQVVELYTSEGCSSCPPADRWLSGLHAGPALVPLAFHVDYWDYLGWQDPYARKQYSRRQEVLASRAGNGPYTPEVAVDGHEFRRWSSGLPAATAPAGIELVLTVSGDSKLTVDTAVASATAPTKKFELWYALTESGLESSVRAGENQGKTLRHDHVVRALSGPHALARGPLQIELPDPSVRAQTRLVALVQDKDTGSYVQAVTLALAECSGR